MPASFSKQSLTLLFTKRLTTKNIFFQMKWMLLLFKSGKYHSLFKFRKKLRCILFFQIILCTIHIMRKHVSNRQKIVEICVQTCYFELQIQKDNPFCDSNR